MEANDEPADTQQLSQDVFSMAIEGESQPLEIVWGRLYGKRVDVRSLGIRTRPKIVLENSSRMIGINIYINIFQYYMLYLYILGVC